MRHSPFPGMSSLRELRRRQFGLIHGSSDSTIQGLRDRMLDSTRNEAFLSQTARRTGPGLEQEGPVASSGW